MVELIKSYAGESSTFPFRTIHIVVSLTVTLPTNAHGNQLGEKIIPV